VAILDFFHVPQLLSSVGRLLHLRRPVRGARRRFRVLRRRPTDPARERFLARKYDLRPPPKPGSPKSGPPATSVSAEAASAARPSAGRRR
jgi:hypothetical protein